MLRLEEIEQYERKKVRTKQNFEICISTCSWKICKEREEKGGRDCYRGQKFKNLSCLWEIGNFEIKREKERERKGWSNESETRSL